MSEKIIEKSDSSGGFNKILANPQYIHILGEVIVIAGVIIYFSRSLKTLNNKIDILAHKVEEQQTIINNYEDVIKKLIDFTQKTNSEMIGIKNELSELKRNRPNIPNFPLFTPLKKPGQGASQGASQKTPQKQTPIQKKGGKGEKKVRFEDLPKDSSKKDIHNTHNNKKHVENIEHLTEPLSSVLPAIFAYQFGTSIDPHTKRENTNTQVEELESEGSSEESEGKEPVESQEGYKENEGTEENEEIDFDEELKAELEEFQ